MQDGINSIANAMELLQSCAKPSICLSSSLAGHNTDDIYFLTYIDVMTWKHFVEYWPFVWEIHHGFHYKGPALAFLVASLNTLLINSHFQGLFRVCVQPMRDDITL